MEGELKQGYFLFYRGVTQDVNTYIQPPAFTHILACRGGKIDPQPYYAMVGGSLLSIDLIIQPQGPTADTHSLLLHCNTSNPPFTHQNQSLRIRPDEWDLSRLHHVYTFTTD